MSTFDYIVLNWKNQVLFNKTLAYKLVALQLLSCVCK